MTEEALHKVLAEAVTAVADKLGTEEDGVRGWLGRWLQDLPGDDPIVFDEIAQYVGIEGEEEDDEDEA